MTPRNRMTPYIMPQYKSKHHSESFKNELKWIFKINISCLNTIPVPAANRLTVVTTRALQQLYTRAFDNRRIDYLLSFTGGRHYCCFAYGAIQTRSAFCCQYRLDTVAVPRALCTHLACVSNEHDSVR